MSRPQRRDAARAEMGKRRLGIGKVGKAEEMRRRAADRRADRAKAELDLAFAGGVADRLELHARPGGGGSVCPRVATSLSIAGSARARVRRKRTSPSCTGRRGRREWGWCSGAWLVVEGEHHFADRPRETALPCIGRQNGGRGVDFDGPRYRGDRRVRREPRPAAALRPPSLARAWAAVAAANTASAAVRLRTGKRLTAPLHHADIVPTLNSRTYKPS